MTEKKKKQVEAEFVPSSSLVETEVEVGVVTILFFWNDYILLYQAIPTKQN